MYRPILKWTPAEPIRKPDNIVSSAPKPDFKPKYLNESTENINFLLTNEYMRMWFKAKEVYEKNTYIREEIIKGECKIKRRNIQRMVTYRRPSKNQFIDEYVQRKIGINKMENQEQNHEKMKYKPVCPKTEANKRQRKVMKAKSISKLVESKISKSPQQDEDSEKSSENGCEIVVSPLNC